MKVVAFNGSPRKDGNTQMLVQHVLRELEKEGVKTESIQLTRNKIHGCIACYKCFENRDGRCFVRDDSANEYIEKMTGAEGIILASPVYFADMTAEMKALIDRSGFVSMANGGLYRNKVGASVAVLRRTGGIHTIDSLNHFLIAGQMIIVGRAIGIGRNIGDVEADEEGVQMAKMLGQRMAWLIRKVSE